MNPKVIVSRMKKEIERLETDPPPGVMCWPKGDTVLDLEAVITGPEGSPYEHGDFKLDIQIPERYPIDPPNITFVTKIYHPNVDSAGRICLDTLVADPKGQWKPSLNLSVALQSIRLLLSNPNPDDPLEAEISEEFKSNPAQFKMTARSWTQKYATGNQAESTAKVEPLLEKPAQKHVATTPTPAITSTKKREREEKEDDDSEEKEIPAPKVTKTRSLRLPPKSTPALPALSPAPSPAPAPAPISAAVVTPPPTKKPKLAETEAETKKVVAAPPPAAAPKAPAKAVFLPPSKLRQSTSPAKPTEPTNIIDNKKKKDADIEIDFDDEDDDLAIPLPPVPVAPKAPAPPAKKKTFSLSLSKK